MRLAAWSGLPCCRLCRGLPPPAMEVGDTVRQPKKWRWPYFEALYGSLSPRSDRCGGAVAAIAAGGLAETAAPSFRASALPGRLYPFIPGAGHIAPGEDFSEGRTLSCLMDAWASLGHFPGAREPTVLRLACQYVLALHSITVWLPCAFLAPGAACALPCWHVEPCAVGGLLSYKARVVRGAAALLPWCSWAWACHKMPNSQGRDPSTLDDQEGSAPL